MDQDLEEFRPSNALGGVGKKRDSLDIVSRNPTYVLGGGEAEKCGEIDEVEASGSQLMTKGNLPISGRQP